MTMKFVLLSATGNGIAAARQALLALEPEYPNFFTLQARAASSLTDRAVAERFCDEVVRQADVLIVILHGGAASCPHLALFLTAAREALAYCYVHPSDEDAAALSQEFSSEVGSARFEEVRRYVQFDGTQNWRNLLCLLAATRGVALPHDPPQPQPSEALYHPATGIAATLEAHLAARGTSAAALRQTGQPVVGLCFYPGYYEDDNLAWADAIIREVERQGGFPLVCFYMRMPDPIRKNRISDWVVENYFMHEGEPLIHVLLNTMHFSIRLATPAVADAYARLGVPVLQAMLLYLSHDDWWASMQGTTMMEVTSNAAQPEFDGVLIAFPVSTHEARPADALTGATLYTHQPIPERVAAMVRLALRWATLRLRPNEAKRVGIILHNYPATNERIGCATGLDSLESVVKIVNMLANEGYQVDHTYASGEELIAELLAHATNDERWQTPDALAARAVALAAPEQYAPWVAHLPAERRSEMERDWGAFPGPILAHNGQVIINGIINGNMYIGMQPPRGFAHDADKVHDPLLPPPPAYLLSYRWLRDTFQADALLHIGTHGTLEWMPGKALALSSHCYPDLAIMDLPNIYPYIINNPGEGVQAKRRSYACVDDYLIPAMTSADRYEHLATLDTQLLEYMQMAAMNPVQLPILARTIWAQTVACNLDRDMAVDEASAFADFDAFVHRLHAYLCELADAAISDGLHTLGEAPEGAQLVEFLVQLVRLPNGDVPSLRELLARQWGYDYDTLLAQRGERDPSGRFPTYGTALEAIHAEALRILAAICAGDTSGCDEEPLAPVLCYVRDLLIPRLMQTSDELSTISAALRGRHILPGGSGAPTRGMADVLPSGRNFYTVDPQKVPSPAAWAIGVGLGDTMVERYRNETGSLPDTIGMVVWSTPTMRTMGEDIAQILYLMGVRPRWNGQSGRVEGVEPIPLDQLKFPRIDVTLRISGLFRDTFPNLMALVDDAVQMVAMLDEPPERNSVRRNVLRDRDELMQRGLDPEAALRDASFRIFTEPPGGYGTGISELIELREWQDRSELADIFISWGGYAYGRGVHGVARHATFRQRLAGIQLVVKNEDTREYDLYSDDDWAGYLGGFGLAVKTVAGRAPLAYSGDASDPQRLLYRDTQQESRRIFRTRILNPKWIAGLQRHGFKGAGDMAHTMDNVFIWDAVGDVVEDWMYEDLAQRYVLDAAMQQWMREVNPHALESILARLLEAIQRDMWHADADMEARLRHIYLEVEGEIEERTD
ncbi:cobaltochelatase subunit CobN [Candidatus Viridilinea mediisalina]|uniref:Cobaltochelatase subunit CobN n=1 Tax=Candidatus Viridilinea mediisalina TaxID=2024553 RepID=A0A2A6RFD4_9CHLR|nr:cobaltochelatase subunit CobN [Candidatus Viridilinea mediisalina]PDW01596.1 cobaltochelatase subunit CobN [Candidatus Viridilinea mediisalina]